MLILINFCDRKFKEFKKFWKFSISFTKRMVLNVRNFGNFSIIRILLNASIQLWIMAPSGDAWSKISTASDSARWTSCLGSQSRPAHSHAALAYCWLYSGQATTPTVACPALSPPSVAATISFQSCGRWGTWRAGSCGWWGMQCPRPYIGLALRWCPTLSSMLACTSSLALLVL